MEDGFHLRITPCNKEPVRNQGDFVLYWMTACRRSRFNFGLQMAVERAVELKKPLVILEALRCDYQWANERFHRFIIEGMADNQAAFEDRGVCYCPFLEKEKGQGKGLIAAFSEKAAVVVTDDYPAFFLPKMVASACGRISTACEKADSNGILPMRAADRAFPTAYSFRRFLQKTLPLFLKSFPREDPLDVKGLLRSASVPESLFKKWPRADISGIIRSKDALAGFPIDHRVAPAGIKGGEKEAGRRLRRFVEEGLDHYKERRNEPELQATSGLSPYLHFGHISPHEIFLQVMQREEWYFDRLASRANGAKDGWWGMSEGAEAFLDQFITWRELGFIECFHEPHYDRYESLPSWARATLGAHTGDERPYLYDSDVLEKGLTHDKLWNAAQNQLVHEGSIHNYLRMLWGKKILEWTSSPEKALSIMIELNNKYALDGRDPNSYSGIFWTLGRYDRPWGPERPVFGKVRYMSSTNTARKVSVRGYIENYGKLSWLEDRPRP